MITSVFSILLYRWVKREFKITAPDLDELENTISPKIPTQIDPEFSKIKSEDVHFFEDEIGVENISRFFTQADSDKLMGLIEQFS